MVRHIFIASWLLCAAAAHAAAPQPRLRSQQVVVVDEATGEGPSSFRVEPNSQNH